MSKEELPGVRQVEFPPLVLKRIEHDAATYGRSFNDQVIYVLTIGHMELDERPPLPKTGPKRRK